MTRDHDLPGPEAHNLLGFLSLLGLLRALERAAPEWHPRLSWKQTPWLARLHLNQPAPPALVAEKANTGVCAIGAELDVFGDEADVAFTRSQFRARASSGQTAVGLAALAAICAELPLKEKDDRVPAGPLVMMFGQGHQHFLPRLVSVPLGKRTKKKKEKNPGPLDTPEALRRALFEPWTRSDETDGFRWDPDEDQRYALRYDDPSRSGAAPTENGANRLAVLGLLSFQCAPARWRLRTPGFGDGAFVWPLWGRAWSLRTIEQMLAHPDLVRGAVESLRVYGVFEILKAKRISNGKFVNVARALPAR